MDGMRIPGVRGWQISLRSNDTHGQPMLAITTLIVPVPACAGPGARPVVSLRMAYGSADPQCAPSVSKPTAWAAQLQPTYAPELRFAGAAVGGLPADPAVVARNLDGNPFSGLIFAALAGIAGEHAVSDRPDRQQAGTQRLLSRKAGFPTGAESPGGRGWVAPTPALRTATSSAASTWATTALEFVRTTTHPPRRDGRCA
ncbi:lipase family protein [Nocardia sp. CA2R105]|nr:lipase family protein [Nocardia coffeae]